MENNPLISVIIPVYNAEKYLEQCLESVLNQTYKELEVICINDGSSDNSIKILKQYAEKHSRIIVVDKDNEGVSAARNIGLKKAQGDYLMFVDADDWIDCDTCEKAVLAMINTGSDVVIWSYISEHESKKIKKELFHADNIVFDKKDVRNKIHRRFIGVCGEELGHPELADSLCTVWGKLYKRKLILDNDISFIDLEQIGTYEDGMFNLEAFYYVQKAMYLNKNYYHYRRENTASVTSGYRSQLYKQWQNLFKLMADYIAEKNLPDVYKIALSNRIALSILGLGLNELECQCSAKKKIKNIKKILSTDKYREAYQTLDLKYFALHWKLFYYFAKKGNAVGVYLLLVAIKRIISK